MCYSRRRVQQAFLAALQRPAEQRDKEGEFGVWSLEFGVWVHIIRDVYLTTSSDTTLYVP